jgi:ABC-type amino acid transport substrate-binding protein
VLPLGYSFNLDGSMVYQAFAALFIAQAYGFEMTLGQQFVLLLVMMLSTKGVAGVPRASLVVVAAAPPGWADALSGRLLRIKETGVVRLGYREATVPFSYRGPDGKRVGYSLEICDAIVATIAADYGLPGLAVEYVRVTPQDRIAKVLSGAVDLECGATTNTEKRRRQVTFSHVLFVTGTRLAVLRGSAIRDVGGLTGRKVAVVRGTTNEAAMREIERLRRLGMTLVVADGYAEALALLDGRNVDALAADDVLLRGFLAETGRARDFLLVGELLSFEPYGIMFPRDDAALAEAVDRTLRDLAASREIVWIYNRWFVRPLPSGVRLGMPMSVQLRRSFELIGLPPD